MEAQFPSTYTAQKDDGKLAHKYAAEWLTSGTMPTMPTKEMEQAVAKYVDDVKAHGDPMKGRATEMRVSLKDRMLDMVGYIDSTAYEVDGNKATVYIWDLKYGRTPVSAFECWQMICYAAMLRPKLSTIATDIRWNMRIVQPRSNTGGKIDWWEISTMDLLKYSNQLNKSAGEVNGLNPPTISGPWCSWCKARAVCKACAMAASSSIDHTETAVNYDLTDEELGRELGLLEHAARAVGQRKMALDALAIGRMATGNVVPGYCMDRGRGKTIWTAEAEEVETMMRYGQMDVPVEDRIVVTKPLELITPKQAITAGLNQDLVEMYSESIPGAVKLQKFKPVKEFNHE